MYFHSAVNTLDVDTIDTIQYARHIMLRYNVKLAVVVVVINVLILLRMVMHEVKLLVIASVNAGGFWKFSRACADRLLPAASATNGHRQRTVIGRRACRGKLSRTTFVCCKAIV